VHGGTTLSRTMDHANAFAPYGEKYAGAGASDLNFTGQDQDTVSGLYDFLYREYSPGQGRWISPDPAGTGAVDVRNPQSWNTYAYVLGSPLTLIDPLGLGNENDCPPESCTTVVGVPDNVPTIGFGGTMDPGGISTIGTLLARLLDLSERINRDWSKQFPCNQTPAQISKMVRNDFSHFADLTPSTGRSAVFTPGPISQGETVGINISYETGSYTPGMTAEVTVALHKRG